MSQPHYLSAIDTLTQHVSIRRFSDAPIPDDMLASILQAARRSPSSSNMQTYSVVVVRRQETKSKLAGLAGNQAHIEQCPVFLAFCADIHRLALACELRGVSLVKTLETTLVSTVDASLVGMSVQTAAESMGLGAVMIGAMRNHPKEVGQLLGLPEGVYVVYGMCLGWPDKAHIPVQKPRLPENLVIHQETYQCNDTKEAIMRYDQRLAEHYEGQGNNLSTNAWTGPIAQKQGKANRPELRATLEAMGFSFD